MSQRRNYLWHLTYILTVALKGFSQYQLELIKDLAARFLSLNEELADTRPCGYPKCGDENAVLIKKGFANGKQRYQCKSCGKKFVYDTMQVTCHSHLPVDAWVVVLEDTLSLASLDSTAVKIGVSHPTAFHMRHKLLAYMEALVAEETMLSAIIEADETYVPESQKGVPVHHRKPRKHGEGASKRGLSDEQLCVCVAADRDGHIAAKCVNRAKPSGQDIVKALASHLDRKSLILCDGASSYNQLVESLDCEKVELQGHESYNKVYHLNTVNGLHRVFKEMMRKYRGVSTKYLNRYAALFILISAHAGQAIQEMADDIRLSLASLRQKITVNSALSLGLLEI